MPMNEDAEAIRRCQRGEIAGLEPLVRRYQLPALRLAYLLTADRALAEDIVQDSFLLAFRGMGRFQADQPFAPWFYRIVTNLARQRNRSAARRHEVRLLPANEGDDAPDVLSQAEFHLNSIDPAEQVERGEERAAMLAALGLLTTKQREAVVLRYYFGADDQTMAAMLQCRPGTARQRLHEGLRALEAIIRQHYGWLLESHTTPIITILQEEARHGTQ